MGLNTYISPFRKFLRISKSQVQTEGPIMKYTKVSDLTLSPCWENQIGTESSVSLAPVQGLEHRRPIMRTPLAHGDWSIKRRRRHLPCFCIKIKCPKQEDPPSINQNVIRPIITGNSFGITPKPTKYIHMGQTYHSSTTDPT